MNHKRFISGLVGMLILTIALSVHALAQAKPATTHGAARTHAPKSDAEIQSCIQQKLASAPKLKDQGFQVSVSNGVATFTGTAKNAGSKGAVSGIARSCGAKQVTNNITVEAAAKKK